MAEIYLKLSILPLVGGRQLIKDGDMTPVAVADDRRPMLSWIALGVVYVVWGSTYLAIRVGVGHLPPLLFAGVRFVVAGALLYPIALRAAAGRRGLGEHSREPGAHRRGPGADGAGRARPGAKAWLAAAVVGILLLSVANGGVTVAERTLPSGLAAVLVATVPLWMILFAWPVRQQRVTWQAMAGLAVGLAGVVVLVGSNGTGPGRIWGMITVLGAAAAWGFGSVLSHRLPLPGHALLAAAIEMLAGGVVLLAAAAATGEFSHVRWSSVPAASWIALAYLIGPGSILAFTAYGYALSRLPVATVSTYAYVNPVVAVLAGILILGEQFTWRTGLGTALVVGSVVIILRRARSAARAGHAAGAAPARAGGTDSPHRREGAPGRTPAESRLPAIAGRQRPAA
jgi:drug/metabolite transporter (DMT)-like permease